MLRLNPNIHTTGLNPKPTCWSNAASRSFIHCSSVLLLPACCRRDCSHLRASATARVCERSTSCSAAASWMSWWPYCRQSHRSACGSVLCGLQVPILPVIKGGEAVCSHKTAAGAEYINYNFRVQDCVQIAKQLAVCGCLTRARQDKKTKGAAALL